MDKKYIVFAFSLLAITAQIYTVHTVMRRQVLLKERVYDFSLIRVSTLYLIIQLISSLFFMGFASHIPIFVVVMIEFTILAIAVAGFFAVKAAQREIARQDIELQKNLMKMEELQARINLLISQCDEEQIKDVLQKLTEEVRYSNPLSGDISEEIEDEIDALFVDIEAMALDGDAANVAELCDRMKGLLRERDRICKHRK